MRTLPPCSDPLPYLADRKATRLTETLGEERRRDFPAAGRAAPRGRHRAAHAASIHNASAAAVPWGSRPFPQCYAWSLVGEIAGDDEAEDVGGAAGCERLGAGFQGGAGGHHVVDEEHALARDGRGLGAGEGAAQVRPALGGAEAELGARGACAAEPVGLQGDVEEVGHGAGEERGLVIAAAARAGRVERYGDQ